MRLEVDGGHGEVGGFGAREGQVRDSSTAADGDRGEQEWVGWVAGTDVDEVVVVSAEAFEQLGRAERPKCDGAVGVPEGQAVDVDPGEAGDRDVVGVEVAERDDGGMNLLWLSLAS